MLNILTLEREGVSLQNVWSDEFFQAVHGGESLSAKELHRKSDEEMQRKSSDKCWLLVMEMYARDVQRFIGDHPLFHFLYNVIWNSIVIRVIVISVDGDSQSVNIYIF